jgi:hypothetical protein
MSESDGIDEAFEGMSRIGLTIAGRIGEQLARPRELELRRAQAAEVLQARELQARFDAWRAAARAQLAPVMDNRWWDTASARDIERVHETATAWRDRDPAAHDAAEAIRDQVLFRYGIDVDTLNADAGWMEDAVAQAVRDRAKAEAERTAGRDDDGQAALLLAAADREDREYAKALEAPPKEDLDQALDWLRETRPLEAQGWETHHNFADSLIEERNMERSLIQDWMAARDNPAGGHLRDEAGVKYDSAERRQELADSLDGVADREAVQARLSADQDQGTPPSAALGKGTRTAKARKTRGTSGLTKLLQKGMSR